MLKLDISTGEWPFFRNVLFEDRHQLDTVRQLAMEIHSPRFPPRRLTKEDHVEIVLYAKALTARGFTVYHNRQNLNGCIFYSPFMPSRIREKCLQETYYVNVAYPLAGYNSH